MPVLRVNRRTALAAAVGVWTAWVAPASSAADGGARVAVLCSHQRTCQEAASSLQQALTRQGYDCLLVELPKGPDDSARARALQQLKEAKPAVIASSGSTATLLALQAVPETPVVFFVVPNALDARFWAEDIPDRARLTGVAADVSPTDQIGWIRRLDPSAKTIAVLHSPRTGHTVEALVRAAQQRGITVDPIRASKHAFPKAIDALNARRPDGVLMIPDAAVYNSATVQRLLLWGIRQKKPVWAFSASVVRAGALAGLYSDSGAVGRQTADLVQAVINGTPPSELQLQYPRQVGRAVNDRTAEMINVRLSDKALGDETVRFGERP